MKDVYLFIYAVVLILILLLVVLILILLLLVVVLILFFITTRYYYSGIIIITIIIRHILNFYLLRDHISIICSLYLFCYSFYLYILVFFELKKKSY